MQNFIQLALAMLILVPIAHWLRCSVSGQKTKNEEFLVKELGKLAILLPMRDEEVNAEKKILEIIKELDGMENYEIIVIDSCSSDNTLLISQETLKKSEIRENKWSIIRADKPGKSHAINLALSETSADIFVMFDADAIVDRGWLDQLKKQFSNPEIGVISGTEKTPNGKNSTRLHYRRRANKIRVWESDKGSTLVLEGAIIAWRSLSVPDLQLDENCNADDAQIAIASIRNGYRSIITQDIVFIDRNENHNLTKRSLRRSQGLSRVIINNLDLMFSSDKKSVRSLLFHSLMLYIVFPWALLSFALSYTTEPLFLQHTRFFFISFHSIIIILIYNVPLFRAVIWGSMISVIAHIQYILGKRYSVWETERSSGQASHKSGDSV